MLTHCLSELRCVHLSTLEPNTLKTYSNDAAQAAVLHALATRYPRPLSVWQIIDHGIPELCIDKDSAIIAVWALQAMRLVRVRRYNHLFLTRSGEALTPHFHSIH